MNTPDSDPTHRIALFQKREIRRVIHGGEWWFVITDVVAAMTDSVNPADYLKKLRKRDEPLSEVFKGGDNLSPPPLLWSSTPPADGSCSSAGTPRVFSA